MARVTVSPENFGQKVKEIAEKNNKKMEDVAEDFVKFMFISVIEQTPVGRPETWARPPKPGYTPGKAKGNWFPSVGSPDFSTTESTRSSVLRIGRIMGRVAGNVVYLTNSLPYIYELEKGYSPQQGADWIARTVRGADAKMNEAISKNR